MRKNYTTVDVVHCMLWPTLVIIISITIFLKLESKRRGLTFCGRIEPEDEKATPTSAAEAKNCRKTGTNKPGKTSEHVALFDKLNKSIPEAVSKEGKHAVEEITAGDFKAPHQDQAISPADIDSCGNHPTPRHKLHYLTGRSAHDQHRMAMQKLHKHSNEQQGENPTSKSLTNLNSICVRYVNQDKSGNKKDGYKQMLEKNPCSIDQINGESLLVEKALKMQSNSESPLLHNCRSSSVDWLEEKKFENK